MNYFARMTTRVFGLFALALASILPASAQYNAYNLDGEYGVTAGFAHYFGDLNTRARINRPKPALGIFYKKQFNNYLGVRVSAHYAQLGYSDIYSKNEFQRLRNLSFNTDIWEFSVQGEFNFFKFLPQEPGYQFTPYVSLGVGVFSYNPYAYLDDQKIFLRPLGTEGQNINYVGVDGKTRKPYGSMSLCVPIGVGLKYNVTEKTNIFFQVTNRLTMTDYLDDVSTTYVGFDKFDVLPNGKPSEAALLQDRSYELGTPIGVEGRQRGWSKQRDQFLTAEFGVSFNISSYKCPGSY